jgi:hypothetical protein
MRFDDDRAAAAFGVALEHLRKCIEGALKIDGQLVLSAKSAADIVNRQILDNPPIVEARQLYRRFVINSQDRGGAQRLLGAAEWNSLGALVLFDWDYAKVAKGFGTAVDLRKAPRALLSEVIRNANRLIRANEEYHLRQLNSGDPGGAWCKLLATAFTAATFFEMRAPHPDAADACDCILGEAATIGGNPTVCEASWAKEPFKKEIANVGDAMVANFFKSVGLEGFLKTDIQTMRLLGQAFRDPPEPFDPQNPRECERALSCAHSFAAASHRTVGQLDRLIWAAGSGRFYNLPGELVLPDDQEGRRSDTVAKILRQAVLEFDVEPAPRTRRRSMRAEPLDRTS